MGCYKKTSYKKYKVCFSVINLGSFSNVETTWIPKTAVKMIINNNKVLLYIKPKKINLNNL